MCGKWILALPWHTWRIRYEFWNRIQGWQLLNP